MIRERTPLFRATLLLPVAMASCEPALDPGVPLSVTAKDSTLVLAGHLSNIAHDTAVRPSRVISSLTFPVDVATLPSGDIAVLDRLDRQVVVLDEEGTPHTRFGAEGEGPGEFEAPYALAAFGERVAVLDMNRRLTLFTPDGRVLGVADVGGDTRAVWQRFPLLQWEEPLQMSREDVTRRLHAVGQRHIGVLLQDLDERFDGSFSPKAIPTRFPHHVVVYDSSANPVDTLTAEEGPERRIVRPASERNYALSAERPFALRPLWTAGTGWRAEGHGRYAEVLIRSDDGAFRRIEWERDDSPLNEADFNSYIDWEIEGYRRTDGDNAAATVSRNDRERWIAEELRPWAERPQLMGLLGAGACLALIGFDAADGPTGESQTLTIINLTNPARSMTIRLQSERPGFVRHLSTRAVFRIAVEASGTRVVEAFYLPVSLCADASAA